jgi:hypothetical protein
VRRAVAAVACALACAAAWPAAALGTEASAAQMRTLARAALRDPAALERLRAIDVVDGRSVQLGPVLRGSDDEVRARLRALAAPAGLAAPASRAAGAREQARDVLAQRRFHSSSVPTPLRSVRERIGEALRAIGRPFADAFDWLADRLPGGSQALAVLLAAAALGTAALLAARAGARRAGAGADGGARGAGREQASAVELRRQADDAEHRGELELALRLRFRAGLVDLDARELVELRPALTNHELLRAVPSATLEGLVDGFEAVAYGGRPAGADDLRAARDGWPRVAEEARGR